MFYTSLTDFERNEIYLKIIIIISKMSVEYLRGNATKLFVLFRKTKYVMHIVIKLSQVYIAILSLCYYHVKSDLTLVVLK